MSSQSSPDPYAPVSDARLNQFNLAIAQLDGLDRALPTDQPSREATSQELQLRQTLARIRERREEVADMHEKLQLVAHLCETIDKLDISKGERFETRQN